MAEFNALTSPVLRSDWLPLTTRVEVITYERSGKEIVRQGFVSGRYLGRDDIYDITVPGEKASGDGDILVLLCVEAGRIRVIGEPKRSADIIVLPAYHTTPAGQHPPKLVLTPMSQEDASE